MERNELKVYEFEEEEVSITKTDPTIQEFLKRNLEQFEQLVNKQTKSENENGFQKMLEIQLDRKFEDLETELKKSQVQLFADFENQQKLFLEQLRNKTKMLSYMDSKFDELKKETQDNFNGQNKKVQNQLESVTNQCKKIQSALVNQTKQQGLIQNLVLDLKNYTAKQDAAQDRIEKTEIDYDCKICMDKQVSIALKSCGHIVCCDDCAPKLPRNCPLCRKLIIGKLKIYLP